MDYRFFLTGIKNILLNPAKYWLTIDSDNTPILIIRNSLLLPLALLVTVAAIAGSFIFINTELSFTYSLFFGIRKLVAVLIATYLSSLILRETTYPFDLGRSFTVAFRLVVFSIVPFLLCQVLSSVFESLLFINILALYGLYIFWTGAEAMLKPPQYKKIPLLVSATVVFIAIYMASAIIVTMLTDRIFYSFFD